MVKAKASPKKSPSKKTAPRATEVKTTAPKAVAPIKAEPVRAVTGLDSNKKNLVTSGVVSRKSGKIVTSRINGVGRRKSSVARVWLSKGAGDVVVNGRTIDTYFPTEGTRLDALKPLALCGGKELYSLKINVQGGGFCSQAGAVKLGVARALVKSNEEFREALRQNGLLTVDSRIKERKKPGQKAARRKFQFVKR